jgi:hypothetical protein
MKSMSNRKMTALLLTLALAPLLPRAAPGIAAQQAAKPSQAELYNYQRLKGRQVALFDQWAAEHNKQNGTDLNPAIVYSSLTISQRSTFEAVTHALSRSRLTDDGSRPLRQSALELVTAVNEIAGQVKGLGGDHQFRLYVTLVPDAQEVLNRAREFFRDKDNTVFHKEYTTWKVNTNLKDLRDLAQKSPLDSKGLTANLPSRVHHASKCRAPRFFPIDPGKPI